METRVAAESWDTGDKAMPKAMSVAMRTALIQALALPTDEPDPDSFTYTSEAADEKKERDAAKIERVDAEIKAATTVDELRALWAQASPELQKRITARVEELNGAG